MASNPTLAFLETPRLILRPLEPADADGPYPSWLNDADACAGNSHHVRPYSRDHARAYIAQVSGSARDLVLAVVLRVDGTHVGNISLGNIHPLYRRAEFSILLGDPRCRGKRFGQEAGRVLIAHGFQAMDLRRIECGTFSTNIGMQRLALALGMTQEGIRRAAAFKDGRQVDVIEYGLLRDEFEAGDS